MKLKVIFLFTTLTICQSGFAQVRFEAKVNKTTLGLNEELRLEFVINKDGDDFIPPDFDGFKMNRGPLQSIKNSWVNGKKTYSKTYRYFLTPSKQGEFTIEVATVEIEGKMYKTTPVTIKVTDAVEILDDTIISDNLICENLHLVAEVSKIDPSLNEEITLLYKLYITSEEIQIKEIGTFDHPKYHSFCVEPIDIKELKLEYGIYKGDMCQFAILYKKKLTPIKVDTLVIEPLEIFVTMSVPTNRRSIFDEPIYADIDKVIEGEGLTINVKF